MIVLLLVVGVCYLAHLLMTTGSGPTRSASAGDPPAGRSIAAAATTGWTALDDHQLTRLLDESSP